VSFFLHKKNVSIPYIVIRHFVSFDLTQTTISFTREILSVIQANFQRLKSIINLNSFSIRVHTIKILLDADPEAMEMGKEYADVNRMKSDVVAKKSLEFVVYLFLLDNWKLTYKWMKHTKCMQQQCIVSLPSSITVVNQMWPSDYRVHLISFRGQHSDPSNAVLSHVFFSAIQSLVLHSLFTNSMNEYVGEELQTNYVFGHDLENDVQKRRQLLFEHYGFWCDCSLCQKQMKNEK